MENFKCSICGEETHGWSNNAWPVNNGRCCNKCNEEVVIQARIMNFLSNKIKEKN